MTDRKTYGDLMMRETCELVEKCEQVSDYKATRARLEELSATLQSLKIWEERTKGSPNDAVKSLRKSLNDLGDFYRWEHILLEHQNEIARIDARFSIYVERIQNGIKELQKSFDICHDNYLKVCGRVDRLEQAIQRNTESQLYENLIERIKNELNKPTTNTK